MWWWYLEFCACIYTSDRSFKMGVGLCKTWRGAANGVWVFGFGVLEGSHIYPWGKRRVDL